MRPIAHGLHQPRALGEDAAGGRDACPEQVEQEARAVSQHARTQARISLSALEALVAGPEAARRTETVVLLSEGMVLDPRLVDVSGSPRRRKTRASRSTCSISNADLRGGAGSRVADVPPRPPIGGDGLARIAGATRGAVFRLVGSDPRTVRANRRGYLRPITCSLSRRPIAIATGRPSDRCLARAWRRPHYGHARRSACR